MNSIVWNIWAVLTGQSGQTSGGTATSTVPAGATTPAGPAGAPGFFENFGILIVFGVLILVFWFAMIRPQRKQQKELRSKVEGIRKGDRILTGAGFHVTVDGVKQHSIIGYLGEGRDNRVKVEIGKNYIHNVFTQYDDVEESEKTNE